MVSFPKAGREVSRPDSDPSGRSPGQAIFPDLPGVGEVDDLAQARSSDNCCSADDDILPNLPTVHARSHPINAAGDLMAQHKA